MAETVHFLGALFIACIILLILTCTKKKLTIDMFDAVPNGPAGQRSSGVQMICNDYGLCNSHAPIMTADHSGSPLYQGAFGFGRYPSDNEPQEGCDLSRLKTGRADDSLGSVLEPTTITYPELLGYFGDGVSTAYTPSTMAAARSRDGLIHAGWKNGGQPGDLLTNSDRWPVGYKYQVGSSIQVVT